MSPANDASVAAETVATAFITLTATVTAALRPFVCGFAWLTDVANTSTLPPGAEKLAFARTFASVIASDVSSAAPQVTDAARPIPPMLSAKTSTSTWLPLVAWTLMPADPAVTLPSTDAVVAPETRAVGTETAKAARPPPLATSLCTNAWLSDCALNSTLPLEVICWSLLPSTDFASTSAPVSTMANWMLAPNEPSPDAEIASVRASARFPPIACTVALDELVTLPSSSARTAPFTTARDAYRP